MDRFIEHIEEYNKIKESKIMIVFDDMIADFVGNKKLHQTVKKTVFRNRKLNTSLVFFTQSCFAAPKPVRLSSTHYFVGKTPNKQELHQIAFNY